MVKNGLKGAKGVGLRCVCVWSRGILQVEEISRARAPTSVGPK